MAIKSSNKSGGNEFEGLNQNCIDEGHFRSNI